MKKYLPYLITFLLLSVSSLTYAVDGSIAPITPTKEFPSKQHHTALTKKNWETKLGRKLNFKERISLRLVHKSIKKQAAKTKQKGEESVDGFAIAGMAAGLLGFLLSILVIPVAAVIAGIVAIVLSAIGRNKTQGLKGFRKRGRGLAIAGLVLGIVVVAFWVGIIVIAIAILS